MMKSMRIIGVCITILAVGITTIFAADVLGTRPFRDLTAKDITSATVKLLPPETTLAVEDHETLAALLSQLVIYRRDDSYRDYNGQAVIFTLTMADGSTAQITCYSPFLVIDGVGYRTRYEPCDALSRYANSLL